MIESYVDLVYRGLPLARRVKLTSVRPHEGYVETAVPMPVGTAIRITTDEGVGIDARVIGVTEQTAGATTTAGMQIAPALEDGAAASWWSARVALPDAPPAQLRKVVAAASAPAPAPAAVVPAKTITAPMPAAKPAGVSADPDGATVPMPVIPDEPEDARHAQRTMVMDAVVADELLAQVAADANPRAGTAIEDDGKQTQVMEAVDLSALGLEPSASGSLRMSTNSDADGDASDVTPTPAAAGKRKRKKR